jgi:hypothetical protein
VCILKLIYKSPSQTTCLYNQQRVKGKIENSNVVFTQLLDIRRRGSFYLTSINIQYTYQTKECERLADIQDVSSRRGVRTGCHFCLFCLIYVYIDVRTAAELQKGVSANRSAKTKKTQTLNTRGTYGGCMLVRYPSVQH